MRPELWARQLQPHLDERCEILEQIDTVRGKTVGSVTSKRDALAEFDTTYGRVARCLETFWDLADGRFEAQRLRPAAKPAQAAGKAAAAPQVASRAGPKAKFRETRFRQPTEPRFRAKPPPRAVRNGFRAPKSSQHRRAYSGAGRRHDKGRNPLGTNGFCIAPAVAPRATAAHRMLPQPSYSSRRRTCRFSQARRWRLASSRDRNFRTPGSCFHGCKPKLSSVSSQAILRFSGSSGRRGCAPGISVTERYLRMGITSTLPRHQRPRASPRLGILGAGAGPGVRRPPGPPRPRLSHAALRAESCWLEGLGPCCACPPVIAPRSTGNVGPKQPQNKPDCDIGYYKHRETVILRGR